jgi:hypothetical protein
MDKRHSVFVWAVLVASCGGSPSCHSLASELSGGASAALEDSIDRALVAWDAAGRPVRAGSLFAPGEIALDLDERQIVVPGLSGPKEIRLVADESGDVAALFVGTANFQGVIVAVGDSSNFRYVPVAHEHLRFVSARSAVVCLDRSAHD